MVKSEEEEKRGEGHVRRQHRRMDVPVFIFH